MEFGFDQDSCLARIQYHPGFGVFQHGFGFDRIRFLFFKLLYNLRNNVPSDDVIHIK